MLEYRSSLVEQQVDAELDTALDYPAERAVVVIGNVVDEKRIIEAAGVCV